MIESFFYVSFIWISTEFGEIDAGENVTDEGGYCQKSEHGRTLISCIIAWHRWSAIVTR